MISNKELQEIIEIARESSNQWQFFEESFKERLREKGLLEKERTALDEARELWKECQYRATGKVSPEEVVKAYERAIEVLKGEIKQLKEMDND